MAKKVKIYALIVAAGSGKRAGGTVPKQYCPAGGKPLLRHSVEAFVTHPELSGVVVAIADGHRKHYDEAVAGLSLLPPVAGGKERQDSVRAGLEALEPHAPDYVLIHDAARPFVPAAVTGRILAAMTQDKAVIPAIAINDTVRRLQGVAWEEIPRDGLLRIQTPQAFPFAPLLALHRQAGTTYTDDAALWLAAGRPLGYVEGEDRLRKVTTAEDMMWAEAAARAVYRTATGSGFDAHRLVEGASVTLGGVVIPHDKKLDGHSDADVVLHALVDAILGALAEGDIGQHFPPSDARWQGADSAIFVQEAVRRVAARNGCIQHVDITVICEAPRIAPHREAMQRRVASLLQIAPVQVGIKATTTEGLGFTGKREGIAAQAVVTLSLPA